MKVAGGVEAQGADLGVVADALLTVFGSEGGGVEGGFDAHAAGETDVLVDDGNALLVGFAHAEALGKAVIDALIPPEHAEGFWLGSRGGRGGGGVGRADAVGRDNVVGDDHEVCDHDEVGGDYGSGCGFGVFCSLAGCDR